MNRFIITDHGLVLENKYELESMQLWKVTLILKKKKKIFITFGSTSWEAIKRVKDNLLDEVNIESAEICSSCITGTLHQMRSLHV